KYFRIRMTAAKTGIQVDSAKVGAQAIANAGTNWHHLAVVFDSAFYSLYWDGQPVATNVFSPLYSIPPQPTQLGSILPTGTDLWLGRMDEVAYRTVGIRLLLAGAPRGRPGLRLQWQVSSGLI
ncbi:MAG: hypothetical protein NT154_41650, partial [Verrucomicrobia bacterium]|nr:hypothetical protein [Verrucomicrobiota bacterium]